MQFMFEGRLHYPCKYTLKSPSPTAAGAFWANTLQPNLEQQRRSCCPFSPETCHASQRVLHLCTLCHIAWHSC